MKNNFLFLLVMFVVVVKADNNPVGARAAAMSGASITLSDVYSTQNNQAGLGFLRTAGIGTYYENRFLVKQLSYSSVVAAVPIKKGCFGLTYTGLGYSLYKQSKFGLAYGMALSTSFTMGVQLNYLTYQIGDIYGKASAFTVELGLQGKLSEKVIVAAHVYNPNRAKITDYNNEKLASQLRFGIQYIFSDKLIAITEAEKSSYSKINFKGGLEYSPAKEVFLRAGASSNPVQASFGVGVKLSGLKLDVSSAYHNVLGFSPQVGLSYVFGKSEKEKNPESPE